MFEDDYRKFLSTKLYLIESISLKGMLAGDEKMKEIHEICISSYSDIGKRLKNKLGGSNAHSETKDG